MIYQNRKQNLKDRIYMYPNDPNPHTVLQIAKSNCILTLECLNLHMRLPSCAGSFIYLPESGTRKKKSLNWHTKNMAKQAIALGWFAEISGYMLCPNCSLQKEKKDDVTSTEP